MQRLLSDAEKFSGVKYDINNLGDVYEAIHVIQGELGLTGVAANEAKDTLQGTTGAMKASWENLMAAMTTGEGLEAAMANMSDSVGNFIDVVIRMGGQVAEQLPTVIKTLANKAIENAPAFIASGAELMVKLAVGIVQGIPKAIAKLPEVRDKFKAAWSSYDWAALGKQLIDGIVSGLKATGSAIMDAIKSAISGSALWAWIKSLIIKGAGGGGGGETNSFNGAGSKNAAASPYAAAMGSVPYQPAATAAGGGRMSQQELADLLSNLQVITQVVLQGDTAGLFKVIRTTNTVRTRATGINALAGG